MQIIPFFLICKLSLKFGWLQRIGLLIVCILPLAIMHFSCKSNPKFTYSELDNITEIAVINIFRRDKEPVKTIRDQHQIDAVVRFINKQRSGWSPPTFHFPVTKLKLYLYHDKTFMGSFGIDKSVFSMQREGRFDSKSATEEEIQEILNLIGIEKRILEGNY